MFTNLSNRPRRAARARLSTTNGSAFNFMGGQFARAFVSNSPPVSAIPVDRKRTYQQYASGLGTDKYLVPRHPAFNKHDITHMLFNWAEDQDEVLLMDVIGDPGAYIGVVEVIGMTISQNYRCPSSSKADARQVVADIAAWFVFHGSKLVEAKKMTIEGMSTLEATITGIPTTLDIHALNTMIERSIRLSRAAIIPKPKPKPTESWREARSRKEGKGGALTTTASASSSSQTLQPSVNRSVSRELSEPEADTEATFDAFTFELPFHTRRS
ncbi:hypothetical protein BDZ45DRAFT_693329 [Acephala macrosclerotiorum]|nr:hypothetical protein BDZ45DRAFT_693329 [Acephala macrosclerotiorum]